MTAQEWAAEERAIRMVQKRRQAEQKNDEKLEREQLREARREKERKLREEKPEVYWLMRVAWAIWILIGVESIKALIGAIK